MRMLICMALCLVMLAVDSRHHFLKDLRMAAEVAITPLRYVVNLPFQGLSFIGDTMQTHRSLRLQNNALRQENLALKIKQQKMNIINKENERLRLLLGSPSNFAEKTMVAELINVAMNPYRQQFLINKGLNDGAFEGQAVISANGIIGQISHINLFNATVLLIADNRHDIPVLSNRTGLRTIARGSGKSNQLELLYIPNNADIKVGELMISSGLGGRFPAKYPVATISSIKRDTGQPFAKITATPTANLDRVKEVLLVWSKQQPPIGNEKNAQN